MLAHDSLAWLCCNQVPSADLAKSILIKELRIKGQQNTIVNQGIKEVRVCRFTQRASWLSKRNVPTTGGRQS